MILRPDDTVTAAGEIRIRGNREGYTVPDLNNLSGGFTPPPGTLSAAALPAVERYGLLPQQITAHDPKSYIDITYMR